jgi:arylsulfatase A-like enzyme
MVWASVRADAAARPNFVVILADDLGWGDAHCYNPSSRIPTPNLDRLASQGMRFTDAHSPSAVCTPTRYGLLTGRYAWRTRLKNGVLWGYSPPLIEPGRTTLASLLQAQGYETAAIGKWHLGLGWPTRERMDFGDRAEPAADPLAIDYSRPFTAGPLTVGFGSFFGIPASLDMVPYLFIENDRVVCPPTNRVAGSAHQRQGGGGFWREGPIASGFSHEGCLPELIDRAQRFLGRQSKRRPFFLYLPLTAPHDPWVPVASFRGRSGAGAYGDFVAQVDAGVGEILRTLKERGLDRNTLVMVTSDNGAHWPPDDIARLGHRANGPWRGQKSDLWEGGHRVPLWVRWPGKVKPGSTSDALVCLTDLLATVADILAVPLAAHAGEDSRSFQPALRGRRDAGRRDLVMHSIRGEFAVRRGDWKLVDTPGSGGWSRGSEGESPQLYNLRDDPRETRNLAADQPVRVAELRARLNEIRGLP